MWSRLGVEQDGCEADCACSRLGVEQPGCGAGWLCSRLGVEQAGCVVGCQEGRMASNCSQQRYVSKYI